MIVNGNMGDLPGIDRAAGTHWARAAIGQGGRAMQGETSLPFARRAQTDAGGLGRSFESLTGNALDQQLATPQRGSGIPFLWLFIRIEFLGG